MHECGRVKSEFLGLSIYPEMKNQLAELAERNNLTMSYVLCRLLSFSLGFLSDMKMIDAFLSGTLCNGDLPPRGENK